MGSGADTPGVGKVAEDYEVLSSVMWLSKDMVSQPLHSSRIMLIFDNMVGCDIEDLVSVV